MSHKLFESDLKRISFVSLEIRNRSRTGTIRDPIERGWIARPAREADIHQVRVASLG